MQITNLQPCALLRICCHEDDSLASHHRLRFQTCRPDRTTIRDILQDEAAESVHDNSSAKARGQSGDALRGMHGRTANGSRPLHGFGGRSVQGLFSEALVIG